MFWLDVRSLHRNVWSVLTAGGYHGANDQTLMVLIESPDLRQRFARLVFEVFSVYAAAPLYVPPEELFASFPVLDEAEGDKGLGTEDVSG